MRAPVQGVGQVRGGAFSGGWTLSPESLAPWGARFQRCSKVLATGGRDWDASWKVMAPRPVGERGHIPAQLAVRSVIASSGRVGHAQPGLAGGRLGRRSLRDLATRKPDETIVLYCGSGSGGFSIPLTECDWLEQPHPGVRPRDLMSDGTQRRYGTHL